MEQDLNFRDTDKKVTVQIDNQIKNIVIKELVRKETGFVMLETVDTVLYNPISIDMLLTIITPRDDDFDEESENINDAIDAEDSNIDVITVPKGFVNLKITNLNQNIVYDEQKISFRNGQIKTTMTQGLKIGEYLLIAEFLGNRYYEPTQLTLQFAIGKRKVKCHFHDNVLSGYPNENISLGVTLLDTLNEKKINYCTINYFFAHNNYITQTNEQGYAQLHFSMPSIGSDPCVNNIITNNNIVAQEYVTDEDIDVYWNDDGNIVPIENSEDFGLTKHIRDYEDPFEYIDNQYTINMDPMSFNIALNDEIDDEDDDGEYEQDFFSEQNVYIYALKIAIDNNVYEMEEENIYLFVNKYDTNIIAYSQQNDNENKIIIEGDVINNNDNVEYGVVELYIPNIEYSKQTSLTNDGHFIFEILYSDISVPIFTNDTPTSIEDYSLNHQTKITIIDNNNVNNLTPNYIDKHHLNFSATVQDAMLRDTVTEGMVTFIIYSNDEEVYRYVTELDDSGEAFMSFDISTIGTYNIQAFYHPMFDYLSSQSKKIEYTIREE